MKLGDIRIKRSTHPDGIGVTIWSVEQVKKSTGKYASEGQIHWSNVDPFLEPFTSESDANAYANKLKNGKT